VFWSLESDGDGDGNFNLNLKVTVDRYVIIIAGVTGPRKL
jgi:hypothetical protein